jgi:hypothetical protein
MLTIALAVLAPALFAASQADEPVAMIPEGLEVREQMVHDSNTGTFVPRMPIVWSSDGKQVAYTATRGDDWLPVIGSRVGEPYDFVSVPVAAGGHFAFQVRRTTGSDTADSWLLIDGQTIGPEDWMSDVRLSADGGTIAYWTQPGALYGNTTRTRKRDAVLAVARKRKNGRWKVERGEDWFDNGLEAPLVSQDGSRVSGIVVSRGNGQHVIRRTGKREKEISDRHDAIDALAMSADGSAVAYIADSELYFDGKRIAKGLIGFRKPVVDARGKHVGYVAAVGQRATVGVDEEKQPVGLYDRVLELAFDPHGERLAFVATVGGRPTDWPPGYVEGGEWFVVVRPVGKSKADWHEGPHVHEIRHLVWDEASGRLAYCARVGKEWRLVCGEQQSQPYDHVGRAHFQADGTSIGFGVRVGRELEWKTLALD